MKNSAGLLHGFPVTRRDFLSQGLIGFSGTTLFSNKLFSQSLPGMDCGATVSEPIPVIVYDLAGGAALPGNFLVKDKREDLLPSYHLLGWDPKEAGSLDESLGIPMSLKYSKILQGITGTASAEARAKFRMGGICHFAQSDSPINPLSSIGWLSKYGVKGTRLRSAVGLQNSSSGGNSKAAGGDDFPKPLSVRALKDLTGAIELDSKGALGKATKAELIQLTQSASSFSEAQLEKWQSSAEGKQLLKNSLCSFKENAENLVQGGEVLDPRKDPLFLDTFQINANSPQDSQSVIFASLIRGTLRGLTGPSVLTLGDCDYHDNTQTKGDAKDLEIGQSIGRAVESAHRLKKPLFIQIITDGGCSNNPGTRIWRSDDNDKCMTIVGYYKPTGSIKMARTQVGSFTTGQSAELEALGGLGRNPQKVAAVVLANYLSLTVDPGNLFATVNKVVLSGTFTNQQEMESTLFFS